MKVIALIIIGIILLSSMSLAGISTLLTTPECRSDAESGTQVGPRPAPEVPQCWLVREIEGTLFITPAVN